MGGTLSTTSVVVFIEQGKNDWSWRETKSGVGEVRRAKM